MTAVTASRRRSVISTRFGTFETDLRDVITMIDSLPGFEGSRRFVILSSPAIAPLACLHALEPDGPSFLVIDPRAVHPAFDPAVVDGERPRLGATARDDLLCLALVTIDDTGASANVGAPVVINPRRMVAVQAILPDAAGSMRHPLPLG